MAKGILAVAATLLLATAGLAPGLIGRTVEAEFARAHVPLGDALGTGLQVERYDRRWFGAEATVCADVPGAATRSCAEYSIQHGPLLWSQPRGFGWFATRITPDLGEEVRNRLQVAFADDAPIDAALRMSFNRSVHLQVRTGAARRSGSDATFEFAPVVLDGVYETSTQRLVGSLSGLDVRMGNERLTGVVRFALEAADTVADSGLNAFLRQLSADGEVRSSRVLAEHLLGSNGMEQWLVNGLARPVDEDLLVEFALTGEKIRVGEREVPLPLVLALLEAFQ